MRRRLYFSVSGIGLGHAGRSLKIAEKLAERGYYITFSTYGEAVKYVSRKFKCFSTFPITLGWRAIGGLSLRKTSKFILKSGFTTFTKQVVGELKIISKLNPLLVLSDSRGSTILAAKIHSKPVLTITNQLAVYIPEQKTGKYFIKLVNMLSPVILPKLWYISDRVALMDLPPPYTISERNLKVKIDSSKVFFVGLVGENEDGSNVSDESIKPIKSLFKDPMKPLIYVSATGPEKERLVFVEIMRKVLPCIQDYNFIFTLGNLSGSEKPRVSSNNIVEFNWFRDRWMLIKAADLVISRAGRTTIDQCIMNLKPIIVIPSLRQTEQEENARRVEELGVGKNLSQKNISALSLKKIIREIFKDQFFFIENLKTLSKLSNKLGGVNKIVELALSLLS